jgi:hypothetical protein
MTAQLQRNSPKIETFRRDVSSRLPGTLITSISVHKTFVGSDEMVRKISRQKQPPTPRKTEFQIVVAIQDGPRPHVLPSKTLSTV